jgi:hypothetical protein
MNVTLYIELEGYDDGDFDVSNDYYKSDEEFFDIMDKDVKKYSSAVYNAMSRDGFNNSSAKFGSLYKTTKNAKANNYKSEAIIFDETGKDETVDNLIANCVSQDVVVNIIRFNRDKMDEEFEEDFNFWIDDHNNINQYKDKLGEDKVWENEPTRTFYVEFTNKANETKYVRFENCKILDKGDEDEYAILAEKITLIENL